MDRDPADSRKTASILSFRRRGRGADASGRTSVPVLPPRSPVEDVGRYERTDTDDDYRHRMLMNAAGLAICGVLIITGVWIANKMADIRRDQECVLAGRRNCAQVQVTGPQR
jgi:hypothetical protein